MDINFKRDMGPLGHLRMELSLNAQQMISQVHTNNESMKDAMEKGITQAFEEITAGDNFVNYIKEEAKKQIYTCMHNALKNAIRNAVSGKVTEYAQKVAEKLTKDLKKIPL